MSRDTVQIIMTDEVIKFRQTKHFSSEQMRNFPSFSFSESITNLNSVKNEKTEKINATKFMHENEIFHIERKMRAVKTRENHCMSASENHEKSEKLVFFFSPAKRENCRESEFACVGERRECIVYFASTPTNERRKELESDANMENYVMTADEYLKLFSKRSNVNVILTSNVVFVD